jgi:hypothetical protein
MSGYQLLKSILHEVRKVSGIIVGISSQLAHKHDIGIGLLKIVLMRFYCDYVNVFLYDLVLYMCRPVC